jgi:hypothetical protein
VADIITNRYGVTGCVLFNDAVSCYESVVKVVD